MENNLSKTNVIHINNDSDIISFKNKNGISFTLCFSQCDCACHQNLKNENNNQYKKINNNNSILKLNLIKRNSNSNNYSKQIGKQYSLDYNYNITDINHNLKDSLNNEITGKNYEIGNITDNNYDEKKYDFLCRDKSLLNHRYDNLNYNINTKSIFNKECNHPNKEYIFYKNDMKGFKQLVTTLKDIKNRERNLARHSSLKDFNKNINKYFDNRISNNISDLRNNVINYNYEDSYDKNINKSYINFDNDNIKYIPSRMKYDNNISKLKKNLSMDNKYNYCILYNDNTQRRNEKNTLYKKYIDNSFLDYRKNQNNNLIFNYNNNKSFTTMRKNPNIYETKDYKLFDYKYNYKKDYNNYDYKIYNKENIGINNSSNHLENVIDNFVTMIKEKNYNKNLNKLNINYNRTNLDNNEDIYLPKTEERNKENLYTYKYRDYSDLKNSIKKIENKNKKKLKNEINEKIKEYENKYGKNSNFLNSNNKKSFNINKKFYKNDDNIINNTSDIYNNSSLYNLNNYNKESNSRALNYPSEKNNEENIKKNKYNNLVKYKNEINYNNKDNNKINKKDYTNIRINNKNKEKSKNKDNLNIKENNNDINQYKEENNINNFPSKKDNKNIIEPYDNSLHNKENKNNNPLNKIESNTKIYELQLTPSKLNRNNNKNNTNISYYQKEKKEQIKIKPINNKYKNKLINETVSERVKKFINKKAKINNNNNFSLSSKLNLDTNLSLSDENEKENNTFNTIQRNIDISLKTILTIYQNNEKPMILAFDIENKTFSFQDYSDFGNFEENYKLSLNNNEKSNNSYNGNLFITIDSNLYIITGKNHDMLYMFDSMKKTIIKLCSLKNNHSNGNLLNYENKIICLSGDYNKKVEMYSINKNEWTDLPEMLIERSYSSSCMLNNKNNKYIFNLFGFNLETKEYLNTIEYLVLNEKDSCWKLLKYNNPNLISLNLSKLFCINYDDKKIIIIGGYNGKDNKCIDKYIQLIFDEENFENNIIVEETDRKLKDIDINKKYLFNNGYNSYLNKEKNDIFYEVFDNEFNCHFLQRSNMGHDIFYFHYKI